MKKLFTILFLLISFIATGQVEKTIVKTIEFKGEEKISFDVKGDVVIKEWDEDYIRIVATITAENIKDGTFQKLLIMNRYTIESDYSSSGDLVISMPNYNNVVFINGFNLEDYCNFEIYVPNRESVVLASDMLY